MAIFNPGMPNIALLDEAARLPSARPAGLTLSEQASHLGSTLERKEK